MKTAFIALLTLAGVAGATSLGNYTAKLSNPSLGFTTKDSAFSVAITLDPATLKSYLGAGETATKYHLIQYEFQADKMTGVVTNYSSSGGKITSSGLYYRWKDNGDNCAWGYITNGDNVITAPEGVTNLAQIDWDNVASAGLVYTFVPSNTKGTQTAFTLLDADGATIYSAYNRSAGLTSSYAEKGPLTFASAAQQVYYFNSELSADDVKKIAVQAALAPEPATATLSLLALAGLAARRRRH